MVELVSRNVLLLARQFLLIVSLSAEPISLICEDPQWRCEIYRVALQISPFLRNLPPWKPSPTRQPATWLMEEVEAIPISYSCHSAEQTPIPKESWPYLRGFWNAANV